MVVMKNKSKLRKMKGKAIYLEDYLTQSEYEMPGTIRSWMKLEKGKGKLIKAGHQPVNF